MTHQPTDFSSLVTLLHARARTLRSCPQDAADLAQETALKVWQKQRSGESIDNPRAYALVALQNLARSRWRSRQIFEEFVEEMVGTPPEAPRRIACAELREAIAGLPPEQAILMDMVAEGETSPAALSRITGQPLGTVMSRLARARASLRRTMGLGKATPTATLYSAVTDP